LPLPFHPPATINARWLSYRPTVWGWWALMTALLLAACAAPQSLLDQPVQPAGAAGFSPVAPVAVTAVRTHTPFAPVSPTARPVDLLERRSLSRELAPASSTFQTLPNSTQVTKDRPAAATLRTPTTTTRITTAATWTSTASPAPALLSTLPGQPAAPFHLTALNHPGFETISLDSLQGQPVLLSFFATWCTSCRQEIPLFRSASARYNDRVQFILVNMGEPASKVRQYIQELQLPFPVLLDPDYTLERPYQVRGLPTSYFLDPQGRIVDQYLGVMTEKALNQRLDRLLGQ
jgi:thiol-disulfide isomerase/thioredoxin